MRKTLLLFMLLSVKLTFAQFTDDFTDGNFNANPAWNGDASKFVVNSSKQLQSALSVVAQSVSLSTANVLATNVKYEFNVQMNFDPSASNRMRIYLISDQQSLNDPLNGYFIQIGESGATDSYDLYRQKGTSITKIIDGPAKPRADANFLSAKIRVTRDEVGKWELYTNTNFGNNFTLEGNVTDLTFTNSTWFGVRCDYTATRSTGFIFDDFNITELKPDELPPTLLSAKFLDAVQVEAVFSEKLEINSALLQSNYVLSGLGNPSKVATTNLSNVFRLSFNSPVTSGAYTLTVANVTDIKGNIIEANSTADLFYIKPYVAKIGDVVINEIFADPSPQLGLPAAEFIELWNTTEEYILLNNWKYSDLSTTYTFKNDTLRPNQYLILAAITDVNLFKTFGKTIGLSPWPSLNNDKDMLKLLNENGALIDEVSYFNEWFKDPIKSQGGYTLELIDPKNKCKGIQNWMVSNAINGGSPGAKNSVYQTQLNSGPLQLVSANLIDEYHIKLDFSKAVDSLSAAQLLNYTINNGVGKPSSAFPIGPLFTSVKLTYANAIRRGVENLINVNNLTDCAGNLIDPKANVTILFMAEKIKKNDILISEVLFNPRIGSVDFIEIYNNSNHTLDLKDLSIANNVEDKTTRQNSSATSIFMPAQSYWVLTTNPVDIRQQYKVEKPGQVIKVSGLPSFNNDKGKVVLFADEVVIDQFDYNEEMHLALLKNVSGVSLERISFLKPANAFANFKSAAQAIGFATPTFANSQCEDLSIIKNKVSLVHRVFSPDGDGFEELLQIDYQFVQNGNVANINIYTDKGILVRKLQRNISLATSGNFVWDGLNDSGQKSNVGIYVIKFEAFTLNGKTETFKQTCVLASKLN